MLVFYAGFLFLPWLWVVNLWLFWPDFRRGSDLVIQKCEGNFYYHEGRHDDLFVTFLHFCRHPTVRYRLWARHCCVVSLDSSIFPWLVSKFVLLHTSYQAHCEMTHGYQNFAAGQDKWVGQSFFDMYNLASIDPAELRA